MHSFAAASLLTLLFVTLACNAASSANGIEALHRSDIAATLSRDPKALADLCDTDVVAIQPGAPVVIGKNAFFRMAQQAISAQPGVQVLTYQPEFKDVQVLNGQAYEWGYFSSTYRESKGGEVKTLRGRFLRVLKREPDGAWKFTR